MRQILFLLLISIPLFGSPLDSKVLPPGSGMGAKPNVLFVIDNSGSMRGSKMTQTKAALNLLFSEPYKTEIISKIRPGLGQFPGYGCGASQHMIFTPIDEPTDMHINNIKANASNIRASGMTPLGNTLYYAGKYFKGINGDYCMGGNNKCDPLLDRQSCQKNYIILFTDGGQNGVCSSLSGGGNGRVETVAGILADDSNLFLPQLDGQDAEYRQILTYAIGFGSGASDVDYIAEPGGTVEGYNASDTAGLLTTFQKIINSIIANETTNSSPTIIPSFDNGEDEVLYQALFKPRSEKQWIGKLTKYKLDDDGFVDNTVWNASVPKSNLRKIYTKCNLVSNQEEFKVENYEDFAPCLGVGIGNKVVSESTCISVPGTPDIPITSPFLPLTPSILTGSYQYRNWMNRSLNFYMPDLSSITLTDGINIQFTNIYIEKNYDYIYIKLDNSDVYVITGDPASAYNCGSGVISGNYINTNSCSKVATPVGSTLDVLLPAKPVDIRFHSDRSQTRNWFTLNSITVKGTSPTLQCTHTLGNAEETTVSVNSDDVKSIQKIIGFLRGKDSFNEDSATHDPENCLNDNAPGSSCPDRAHPLSDIYNSRAKYVGKPFQQYSYTSYKSFITANKNRAKTLFVGSNGGLLHAFSSETGEELWAFLPPNLLPFIKNIRRNSGIGSNSQYFVDASPKIMDVWSGRAWKTILLMGFGAGGAGLFALDITTPATKPVFLWAVYNESPIRTDGAKRVIFWDGNGDMTAYQGSELNSHDEYDYSRLGDTFSEPVFAQIGALADDGTLKDQDEPELNAAYAVIGGGGIKGQSHNEFGQSVFIINPVDGTIYNRFDLPDSALQKVGTDEGIAAKTPAMISVLPDYRSPGAREIHSIYAGDLSGRVWRMKPQSGSVVIDCGNEDNNCRNIFKVNSGRSRQKLHQMLSLSFDRTPSDSKANLWVYLGTGSVASDKISSNDLTDNYLYAFKDEAWDTFRSINKTPLLTPITTTTNQNICDADETNGYQFKIGKSEKLVATPTVIDGYIYYTTYDPGAGSVADVCSIGMGESYLYSFQLFTGCKNPDFKKLESDPDSNYKIKLGGGMATAPVVKGQNIYFGISGTSNEDPELHNSKRQESLIKWKRTDSVANKHTVVPFTYFREIF